jgi:hypothetical protein
MQIKTEILNILEQKFFIKEPDILFLELREYFDNPRLLLSALKSLDVKNFDVSALKKYGLYIREKKKEKVRLTWYDVEATSLKLNMSLDEARAYIETKKTNKTTNLAGFIKRHGEEKGKELFEKFQNTSKYSSSEDWFREKYGDNWEIEKTQTHRKRSKRCVDYWMSRGFTEQEAKNQVSEYQLKTAGVNREYYLSRGFTEEETSIIIQKIDQKKKNHRRNREYLKEKYPNNWQEIYRESLDRYRKNMEERGQWTPLSILDDFQKYRSLVLNYTRLSVKIFPGLIENLEKRSRDFHLDHRYSLKMGFINDIPAEIIGSPVNLEIIPGPENCVKQAKCSISQKYLLQEYKKFKEQHK